MELNSETLTSLLNFVLLAVIVAELGVIIYFWGQPKSAHASQPAKEADSASPSSRMYRNTTSVAAGAALSGAIPTGTDERYSLRNGMGFFTGSETKAKYDLDIRVKEEFEATKIAVGNSVSALGLAMWSRLSTYFACCLRRDTDDDEELKPRPNSLIGQGFGPWGIGEQQAKCGGECNSWHDLDATEYAVRTATYLSTKKKCPSPPAMGELLVVDLFKSEDIAQVSSSEKAQTVQRIRDSGETRKLFVLNFRLVPLHAVAVWALPDDLGKDQHGPAGSLLEHFFHSMADGERRKKLKVIPRTKAGPWFIKKAMGENKPAILGKKIPIEWFSTDDVLEASVSISKSAATQWLSQHMIKAATALDIEVVVLLEGQCAEELPERVLGGFRVSFADTSCVRKL